MKTLEVALKEFQEMVNDVDKVALQMYGEDECRGIIGGFGAAICSIYGLTQEELMGMIQPNTLLQEG